MQRRNVAETTDEQLIQAVAEGDLDAFEEIVLRYRHLAWKTVHRFLGDSMEAEDVAQDVFLKVLEAAPRYRPTASFRTYFYSILTHLCIDYLRKGRPTCVDDIPDIPDPSTGPAENLIASERDAQVRDALNTLPPNQKAAIVLRHYEGLSYLDISKILGATPKAVEMLIRRARTALRSRLVDKRDENP